MSETRISINSCEYCGATCAPEAGICELCLARPEHQPDGSPDACPETAAMVFFGVLRCPQCGWEGEIT